MKKSGTLKLQFHSEQNVLAALADAGNKGRGLFALGDIPKGTIILRCPYIVLGPNSAPQAGTELEHYVFSYPFTRSGKPYDKSSLTALVFGNASMLNHSEDANCNWEWDVGNRVHLTRATRDIRKNEELTIFYGWDPEVWDAVGGMKA